VRILLILAFGLAFGIEGMTLVRSFLLDTDAAAADTTASTRPVLTNGTPFAPSVAPTLRARQLRVRATDEAWTFALVARPDSALERRTTLSFDRLVTSGGTPLTSGPHQTWAPGDTASFRASWALSVGQRPDALTVTATASVGPDSTTTTTRTLDVGHVPVRMQ
jgi:hypothetical protein